MKSFLSRFADKLDNNYGGRYFSAILHEICLEDNGLIRILFPGISKDLWKDIRNRNFEIIVEYAFSSSIKNASKRRADLALCVDDKPIALLEVKDDDDKLPKNFAQLSDYINFVKKNRDVHFTYLTKHLPPKRDILIVNKNRDNHCRHLLFANVIKQINKIKHPSPAIQLLTSYMKERISMYNPQLNEKALSLLVVKGLSLRHQTGLRRLVSEESIGQIPKIWATLIDNLTDIGSKFYSRHSSFFNTKPSIDFGFETIIDKKVVKDFTNDKDWIWLDRDRKIGGIFYIACSNKFAQKNPDNWLNITYGFYFYFELGNDSIRTYLYSEVAGNKMEFVEKQIFVRQLPKNYETCYRNLMKVLLKAIEESLIKNESMKSNFRKPLENLRKEIKNHQ